MSKQDSHGIATTLPAQTFVSCPGCQSNPYLHFGAQICIPTLTCLIFIFPPRLHYSRTAALSHYFKFNQLSLQPTRRTQCFLYSAALGSGTFQNRQILLSARTVLGRSGGLIHNFIRFRFVIVGPSAYVSRLCFRFCLGNVQIAARCTAMM